MAKDIRRTRPAFFLGQASLFVLVFEAFPSFAFLLAAADSEPGGEADKPTARRSRLLATLLLARA